MPPLEKERWEGSTVFRRGPGVKSPSRSPATSLAHYPPLQGRAEPPVRHLPGVVIPSLDLKLHRGARLDLCAWNGTLQLHRRIEERDVALRPGGEVVSGPKPGRPQFDLSIVGALAENVRNRDEVGISRVRVVPDLKVSEVENECRDSEREAHAHNEDEDELDWVGNAPSPGPDHPRLVLLRDPRRLALLGHAIPVPGGVRGTQLTAWHAGPAEGAFRARA